MGTVFGALIEGRGAHTGGFVAELWVLRQVVVRPELAEHLMTTGDIGVPASALCKRFPLVRLPGGPVADA